MLSQEDCLIIDEINNKINIDRFYFSYNDVTQKEGIHNFARYPATMVPEMQKDILEIICKNSKVKNILDPFMGSGTVLVEGIKNDLDVYGLDINPYAYYLSKSKLTLIDIEELDKYKNELIESIDNDNSSYEMHTFENIDKWFRQDYQDVLSKIRDRINRIEKFEIRLFFLIAFSDVITTLKNSQSSTFKLHIKKTNQIQALNKDAIKEFKDKIQENIVSYKTFLDTLNKRNLIKRKYKARPRSLRNNVNVSCGDARELKSLLNLRKNSIDLIVTSPPYGDNLTTVTYGQYSTLPLFWMCDSEIKTDIDSNLLSNYSAIDTASLGGRIYSKKVIEDSKILIKSKSLKGFYNMMIENGREDKGKKVASFIIDFNEVLKQLHNVLKVNGYMVFVVGNRRVHNKQVPFDKIINELLANEFKIITEFDRLIKNKKIASKISRVDKDPVKSMDTETIIIMKKK